MESNDVIFTSHFVEIVKKPHNERTAQDNDYLCHLLKKLSEFQTYDNTGLRNVLQHITYETHPKGTEVYRPGDKALSWYYVVQGSIVISGDYVYGRGCSFGQCIDTNIRTDACRANTDPTVLLRIDYTDKELERFMRRATKGSITGSLTNSMELTLVNSISRHDVVGNEKASMSDGELSPETKVRASEWNSRDIWDIDKLDPIMPIQTSNHGNKSYSDDVLNKEILGNHDNESGNHQFDDMTIKTMSTSSDSLHRAVEDDPIPLDEEERKVTASEVRLRDKRRVAHRRSAPPTHQRSLRDSVGSLDYLSESQVDIDSDDDESAPSETSSSPGMDSVYEILNKPPSDRTEEDIERLMDVLQYMPAFSNMTSNIRHAVFKVLLLTTFSEEGAVVLDNGNLVDRWFVVLHGHVRLTRDSECDKMFHIGESFGLSKNLKILPHRGKLLTGSKDCQLCYVTSEEYGRVLAQGEENLKRIEEDGKIVAVLEKRAITAKKEGYFVVQATPEKLLEYLMEEGVDDTFHSDFLLTYRSFYDSIHPIMEKIKSTWTRGLPEQRERITMIMLNWIMEHYSDFEDNECYLDWLEEILVEDGKIGEKRILDEARITNAKIRTIHLERDGINVPLEFDIVGGWELQQPIFVSDVKANSHPAGQGLKTGDQLLSVNDMKCDKKELREVWKILQKNFKLELTVKSNIPKFKLLTQDTIHEPIRANTISCPPSLPVIVRSNSTSASVTSRVNHGNNKGVAISKQSGSPKNRKKPSFFKPIVKTLSKTSMEKFKSRLRNSSTVEPGSESPSGPLKASRKLHPGNRKASKDNLLDDHQGESDSNGRILRPASSAEDLHVLAVQASPKLPRHRSGSGRNHLVSSVVKLYSLDHSVKYMDITPFTSVAELIERGVKEFYPDRFVALPSDEFCICMVTVQIRGGPIKNSVLPGHLTDLANFIGLESRYYLKERAYHGTLVQDDEADRIVKESRQWEVIYNLKAMQVAAELTEQDSKVFSYIGPSEFIADLWKNPDMSSRRHLVEFESIPNDEMYWVITTIVSEPSATNRAKIIRHFIKIAKCCKILKNYNSMFHLLSGLNHGLVQRLKSSWEKVPHRYKRTMEELASYMNPFHNMVKYRELQRLSKPPLIPFFPIIKKDLTFLFDGNDTIVNGLINFEKLRMLSRQIYVVKGFCTSPMLSAPPEVDLNQIGGLNRTIINSLHGSLRWKQRSPSNMVSLTENALKRVYCYNRMSKMVKKHLSRKFVLQDENYLEQIVDSQEKLSNVNKKNPPSPLKTKKGNLVIEAKHRSANLSPSPTATSLGSDVSGAPQSDPFPQISSTAHTSLQPPLQDHHILEPPMRSASMNSLTSTSSAPK